MSLRVKCKADRENRLGEINTSNSNMVMKIIEYNGCDNIIVEFEDGYRKNTTYGNFKKGEIRHPNSIYVYGVGYLGTEKRDDFSYDFWHGMMKRCYSKNENDLIKYSAYNNCSVSNDWHNYSNFKLWFDQNYYKIQNERMELDKDILYKGNKIYSEQYCVFVPQRINKLFTNNKSCRGISKVGTTKTYNNKFICQSNNKTYENEIEAFNEYKKEKELQIKQVANYYKNMIPKKLYDAMYKYEIEEND